MFLKDLYRQDQEDFYLYDEQFLEDFTQDYSKFEELIDKKFTFQNSTNLANHQENFLHLMIKHWSPETIESFWNELAVKDKEKLKFLLNESNKIGWIPLYYVFKHKSVDLLKTIINFDQKTVRHVWNTGSVLIKACEVSCTTKGDDHMKWLETLLSHPICLDVNQPDNEGCTPLYMAWFKGNFLVAKYLLENGADPGVNCINGSTPLHICAERDFKEILQLLVLKRQDLVYSQDEKGQTPLHIACLWSHMGVIELLWEQGGKKLVEIKNKDGDTAYELAYEENQIYAYEFLCEKMGIKTSFLCSIL